MFKPMRAHYYYIINARLNLLRFRTGGVVVYRNATEMNSPQTDIRAHIALHFLRGAVCVRCTHNAHCVNMIFYRLKSHFVSNLPQRKIFRPPPPTLNKVKI